MPNHKKILDVVRVARLDDHSSDHSSIFSGLRLLDPYRYVLRHWKLEPAQADDYEFLARLGEGGYGQVDLLQHRTSGELLCKKTAKEGGAEALRQEENILRMLDHPHVVRLVDVGAPSMPCPSSGLYITFCEGGSLSTRLESGVDGQVQSHWPEQLASTVVYLHRCRVAHRDVKPANVVLKAQNLILCDFGSAIHLPSGEKASGAVGTLYYMAPELFQENCEYDFGPDCWSLARVVLDIARAMTEPTSKQAFAYVSETWGLVPDPVARPSAQEFAEILTLADKGCLAVPSVEEVDFSMLRNQLLQCEMPEVSTTDDSRVREDIPSAPVVNFQDVPVAMIRKCNKIKKEEYFVVAPKPKCNKIPKEGGWPSKKETRLEPVHFSGLRLMDPFRCCSSSQDCSWEPAGAPLVE